MSVEKSPPKPLRSDNMTARIVRQKIWRRCNVKNMHFMGAIVGREGTGKSYTALKISELVDPSFDATRVIFEPARLLEMIQDDKIGQGDVVILDEAGVGLGVRSWYEKDQILLNQTLQVIRDENIACLFTLPRLSELDSQSRGRLHAFLEMVEVNKEEEWARAKWKNIDPTRDEKDKIYKKYPRVRVNGSKRRVTSLYFKPPTPDLVEEYEERKQEFKKGLYEETIGALDGDDEGEERDLPEIAEEIIDEGVDKYVSTHPVNKSRYVDSDLIESDYGLSARKASKVKKLVEREVDVNDSE